ncbi:MAG: hypothetical protein IPI90_12630 [Saprospiraceae bacterium]|nr:hypothetical protein [Candidatus Vicinibacter affinis]
MSKNIYIIAGEASGDLYGSKLLAALHSIDPGLKARGWGGQKMAAEGCVLKSVRRCQLHGICERLS